MVRVKKYEYTLFSPYVYIKPYIYTSFIRISNCLCSYFRWLLFWYSDYLGLGAGAFAVENMATLSLAVNFVSYFTGIMHYELADAANMVTNYMGVNYMLSIVVAVLADTWIGRYKSVVISGIVESLVRYKITLIPHCIIT